MSAAESAPVAAVVVVTHDSAHAIGGWLEAAEAAAATHALELCVVDSGSRPEERRRLRAAVHGRVSRLVELPNVGFGASCNAGARATTAPVLIFTNPDTRIRSLPATVAAATSIDGTVIGAYAAEPDGSRLPLAFERLPTTRRQVRNLLLGGYSDIYRRTVEHPAWVLGAALAISRADFERLGGFWDGIFLYFEDADLCARHGEAGGRCVVDPSFVVEHDGASSTDWDARSMSLEGIGRQSGRRFAVRHGRRLDGALLYAVLAGWYVPRRVALTLLRRLRGASRSPSVTRMALDVLFPSREKRRLGVVHAHRDHR